MYIFGITGGTGCGKSTVSDMFRKRGIYVSDCDNAAREIVKKGTPCLDELSLAFGSDVLESDGALNRRRLASIVFTDMEKLCLLNKITHKYIKEYIETELKSCGSGICAIDGAVIIGSPVEELCRKLVVVTADYSIRLSRIMKRDSIGADEAENRINSQMPDNEYISRADYIIDNSGGIDDLGGQIEYICSEIENEQKKACQTKKEEKK